MKNFSRLLVLLFLVSMLVASCATPAKKVKHVAQEPGKLKIFVEPVKREKEPLTFQNHPAIHQRIEQSLDSIDARLRKIEQVLGLNAAQEQVEFSDSASISLDSDNINELSTNDGLNDSIQQGKALNKNTLNGSTKLQYNRAHSLLIAKKFNEAEKQFKIIVDTCPEHPLAVNALYWMGECRYSVKDYKGSIDIFKQLVETYPNGRKVPDALLKTAYAYLSLNDTDNAREYLKKVVMQFPFSPAGEKAELKLKSLR